MLPAGHCTFRNKSVRVLLLVAVSGLAVAQETEFDSLADVDTVRERIREERQRGNAETAWNLEQELLGLTVLNPDDLRSARILRDAGDYRLDMLSRFDAGNFPREIVLGCYYDDSRQYIEVSRRGSQPLSAAPSGSSSCANGNHNRARRALAAEALSLYVEAVRNAFGSEQADGDEIEELLMAVLATSYRNTNYDTGRWSLLLLSSHQDSSSASWLDKARTLALMGDWNLLFARHFGTQYSDSAIELYEQALALLSEHRVFDDSIFSRQTPILLPEFAQDRLMSERSPVSIDYVDIEFEIRKDGKTRRARIVESSGNVPRGAQRGVMDTIKYGRFRPIAENGQLLESAPVTVRYYFD